MRAKSVTQHESAVEQFYRRIVGWCILRQSVGAVTLWAFLWGTAVLIIRTTQDASPIVLLWGLIGVPLALAFAVRAAMRQLPSRTSIRALLDDRGNCGGLLMAGAERNLGRWTKSAPAVAAPRVIWDYRRPVLILATSIVYILLGFLLPIDRLALAGDSQLDVGKETERLSDQVRILKEEKILDAERAETIKKKLEQLRADSSGKDPAKTLEALDHLNDVMKETAKKAGEAFARDVNKLGKVETAAEALQLAADELDPKTASTLMAELSAMAEKAAAESERFREGLDSETAEALSKGKLSPEQMAKLSSAARNGKESLKKSAERLYKGKLIDSDLMKMCNGEGKCDAKELSEYLKKNGGKCCLGDALEALDGQEPGRGGVNEGPGAAAIQFGDRSSENGTKFLSEALPPGNIASLKESQVAGVSSAAPQRDPKSGSATTGALNGAMVGGGSANTGQILPQHKGPVERYFDRSKK
jgi:hypothetical protein